MHFGICNVFYSRNSQQNVSAGIPGILRVIIFYKNAKVQITRHRPNNFFSKDLKNYPFLAYNYITHIHNFNRNYNCSYYGVMVTQVQQICTFYFKLSPCSEGFGTLYLFHLHRQVFAYMKMEQTECSETSAYKIQTPGNYPEESIQQICIFVFLYNNVTLRIAGMPAETCWWELCEYNSHKYRSPFAVLYIYIYIYYIYI